MEQGYAVRSINSMLASVNSLLDFLGLSNCKAKSIRIQQQTYSTEDKELTKAEYLRLLMDADTTKTKDSYEKILTAFSSGEAIS